MRFGCPPFQYSVSGTSALGVGIGIGIGIVIGSKHRSTVTLPTSTADFDLIRSAAAELGACKTAWNRGLGFASPSETRRPRAGAALIHAGLGQRQLWRAAGARLKRIIAGGPAPARRLPAQPVRREGRTAMAAPGGAEAQGARLLTAPRVGIGADEPGGVAAVGAGWVDVADRRLRCRRRGGEQYEPERRDAGAAARLAMPRAQVSSS